MLSNPNDHVEIASRSAVSSGVTLARQPNPLPIAGPSLDSYLQWFGPAYRALAVAGGTSRNIFSRPLAPRAHHVELHPPARLRDLSGSVALRTFSRRFDIALPVTIPANILPRNVEPHHAAADRG